MRPRHDKPSTATARAWSASTAETVYVSERRVVHIATNNHDWLQGEGEVGEETIGDIISREAGVSVDHAIELVRFGAVYIGEQVPRGWKQKGKRDAGAFDGRGNERARATPGAAPGSQAQRRKIAAKAADQAPFQGTSFEHVRLRRLDGSEASRFLPVGSYLRVHCDPRTFPIAQATDWGDRVVDVTDDYVVIDKPAGVPTVPTIDNAVENALYQAGLAVAVSTSTSASTAAGNANHVPPPQPPLHAVSRLDVCTSGLVIFARNKPAAAQLNQIFRERRVNKRYLALLTPGPAVNVGPASHCCRSKVFDGSRRPRIYADYDPELLVEGGGKWGGGWQEALCTVLLCKPARGSEAAAAVARDLAEAEVAAKATAAEAAAEATKEKAAATLEASLIASLETAAIETRGEARSVAEGTPTEEGHALDEATDHAGGATTRSSGSTANASAGTAAAASGDDRHPPHLCAVELETGRTHQLRLQLAAMGAGIVGDTRYRGVVGRVHRGLPADDRVDAFGQEPESISLQAARLEFEWRDRRVVYSAKRASWALEDAGED